MYDQHSGFSQNLDDKVCLRFSQSVTQYPLKSLVLESLHQCYLLHPPILLQFFYLNVRPCELVRHKQTRRLLLNQDEQSTRIQKYTDLRPHFLHTAQHKAGHQRSHKSLRLAQHHALIQNLRRLMPHFQRQTYILQSRFLLVYLTRVDEYQTDHEMPPYHVQ